MPRSKLPPQIEDGLSKLAKWAAQDPTHKRAVDVIMMLQLAGRIKAEGTHEHRRAARQILEDFNGEYGPMDLAVLNDRLRALMGWSE